MTDVRSPSQRHDEDRRPDPPDRRGEPVPAVRVGSLLAAGVVALGLLGVLWFGVVLNAGLAVVDPLVTGWWARARTRSPELVAHVVSAIGGPGPTGVLLGVTAVVLSCRRASVWPAAVGLGGLAALTVIDLGVKAVVARPRPPEAWRAVTAAGWSFPSGHATFAAGTLLLLVWMLNPRGVGRRTLACGAAVAGTVLVGCSRIVLGVHYPSDVLAGWCLGVATDAGVLLLVALVRHHAKPGLPVAVVSGAKRSGRSPS